MKLLLHTCCAPCSIQSAEALAEEGFRPDLFWYNPNIHPYTEYCSRRDSLEKFAAEKKLNLITEDEYGLRFFVHIIETRNMIDSPDSGPSSFAASRLCVKEMGRCGFCYKLRLEKTAAFAANKGYNAFSSTLLISPYQKHDLIKQIGEELALKHHVEFLYRDFRPRFRESQKHAREAGYYMQKYCGCIYSEEERYLGQKERE